MILIMIMNYCSLVLIRASQVVIGRSYVRLLFEELGIFSNYTCDSVKKITSCLFTSLIKFTNSHFFFRFSVSFQQSRLHRRNMQTSKPDNQWSCGWRFRSSQSQTSHISVDIRNISSFLQTWTNVSSSHRNMAVGRANWSLSLLLGRSVGVSC